MIKSIKTTSVQTRRKFGATFDSMNRKGNYYDNPALESFWSTLKLELVYRRDFQTRAQARTAIFDYIEALHDRQRSSALITFPRLTSNSKTINPI